MLRLGSKLCVFLLVGALAGAAQTQGTNPAAAEKQGTKPATNHHGKGAAGHKEAPPAKPVPIQQMWPEQLPAEAPHVDYQNGVLTVDSQNSRLGDVFNEIRKKTGAEFDIPPGTGNERVAARLSGSPRDVITSLLDGSNLGYIILGSPENPLAVQKVILSVLPKDQGTTSAGNQPPPPPPQQSDDDDSDSADQTPPTPPPAPPARPVPMPGQPMPGQPSAGVPGQPNPNGEQNPSVGSEQPGVPQPGQNAPGDVQSQGDNQNPGTGQPNSNQPVKTPEQLLQELQQMRAQQQNSGQPPAQQ